MNEKTKIPAPFVAIIPLIVLVALLALVIPTFGSDALLGGSQVSLLVASALRITPFFSALSVSRRRLLLACNVICSIFKLCLKVCKMLSILSYSSKMFIGSCRESGQITRQKSSLVSGMQS